MEDDLPQEMQDQYDYTPRVKDPTDPMRGTVRGFFGMMTGDRQQQVAAARQQLEMEARARQVNQMKSAYLLDQKVKEAKFNQEFPDIDVKLGGETYNIRKLAQANPEMATQLRDFKLEQAARQAQVEMAKAAAEQSQAEARIAASQRKIQEEQSKTPVRLGPLSFGGPNQRAIDEERGKIQTESETYGIPLGSEPEGAEPTPATQTGAASTWLRSKLK